MNPLAPFHPSLKRWFEDRFGAPTDVQASAWPHIEAGRHVLATAPTGSGKTLTAFFWSLDRFVRGEWQPGQTRVLYVSPLKALNNDIQRNLEQPLAELQAGYGFPALRAGVRSGDTPANERQRMLRNPPDILLTTPESLMLLLTTARGRLMLSAVETVILDEIHALVDNRRGAALMLSVERLSRIAGEFQRIALSATVRPLATVARFIGGHDATGEPRAVEIVDGDRKGQAPGAKKVSLEVQFPRFDTEQSEPGTSVWERLADDFRELIESRQGTLLFTNSRQLAERIARLVNPSDAAPLAYAHHGSLARDIRLEVEQRLKAGELKAIVATSSLEMGIDIGHLDQVVLVQTPPSIDSALQRIGRAGHAVGEESHGVLMATHAQDLLAAAALAEAVAERDIEPRKPLENPLDVLCQAIISICADEAWPTDEIFGLIRKAMPFRHLPREQFDMVLEFLAGRYAGARVREVQPRIDYDRIRDEVRSRRGALLAYYRGGGVIPDRGYYQIRQAGESESAGSLVGELDEEFVWEARTGQVFTLGAQNWQILEITHSAVLVRPAPSPVTAPPFWRNEAQNRSVHFSRRIADLLQTAEETLAAGRAGATKAMLQRRGCLSADAAEALCAWLERQRQHTGTALPHSRHLLIEWVQAGPGGHVGPDSPRQLILHTFWGGRLNRPFAIALAAAWKRAFGTAPEIHAENDAIAIQWRDPVAPEQLLELVTADNLDSLLRSALEGSAFFGARFRECAGRSLLLTKQRFNQRLPLWMSRLQAKKLMTAIKGFRDFPVLLETWRTCLVDEFDLPALKARLEDLRSGAIAWSLAVTKIPSPFASQLAFNQISRYMYADDKPEQSDASTLADDLIEQAVADASLRPRIEPAVIELFEAKRQRRSPGYAPAGPDEWREWARERVLIPAGEWPQEAGDAQVMYFSLRAASQGSEMQGGSTQTGWVAHPESASGLIASGLCANLILAEAPPEVPDQRGLADFLREVLSFYGPRTEAQIKALLPPLGDRATALDDLLNDSDAFVSGPLVAGTEATHYCDRTNLEILLRMQRAGRRPRMAARPAQALPGFLAAWTRFGETWTDAGASAVLDALAGYPAPVECWLQDFMASRLANFAGHKLDALAVSAPLAWVGCGKERITVCHEMDLDEHAPTMEATDETAALARLFVDPEAGYGYHRIRDRARSARLAAAVDADFNDLWWQAVWSGRLTAADFQALRLGLQSGYRLAQERLPRRQRVRRVAAGWPGHWRLLPEKRLPESPMARLEADKALARRLLARYGVLCREIVNRESRWQPLFRALRVMELAGEVLVGRFFEGLSGPQFLLPRALPCLLGERSAPTAPQTFWMSALDPAAPCGLGLEWPELPARRAGNYLSFAQGELALVVENRGDRLRFLLPPEGPNADAVIAPIRHLCAVKGRVQVSEINGEPARRSPWIEVLDRCLVRTSDHRALYYQIA